MTEQEKFEAWIASGWPNHNGFKKTHDGQYEIMAYNLQWRGWQAAIASREQTELEKKYIALVDKYASLVDKFASREPKMRKATRDEKIVNPGVYEVPAKDIG